MRRVKSTGPDKCPYLLIGERPGKVEAQRGVCFCGPSGLELDRYLFVNAGLNRDDVHCTNLVPYYAETPPTPEEIDANWDNLQAEVNAVDPDFVGLVGLYSVRALLGNAELTLDWSHGLMFPSEKRSCLTMPLHHPAAGLHQPAIAAKIAWDFEQFGKMVRGEEMPVGHLQDSYPDCKYYETAGLLVKNGTVGIDTEGSAEAPWCLSASYAAGSGVVVRNGNIDIAKAEVVLHHAIHDLQVLEAMGVRVHKFTDTMLIASLLSTEPLGLKALARRHCGMVQQDYADVIAPAKREKALEYLSKVMDYIAATQLTTTGD